jgi:hypothetical protein
VIVLTDIGINKLQSLVNFALTNVISVSMLPTTVLIVLKIVLTIQNVVVQLELMKMVTQNVQTVLINVMPVKEKLLTVPFVVDLEESTLHHVFVQKDISIKESKFVLLVDTDVFPVKMIWITVPIVSVTEKMLLIVNVQMVSLMTKSPQNVYHVLINVSLVLELLISVLGVMVKD